MSSVEIKNAINSNKILIDKYTKSKNELLSLANQIENVKSTTSIAMEESIKAIIIDNTSVLSSGIGEINNDFSSCISNLKQICSIIDFSIKKLNNEITELNNKLTVALYNEKLANLKKSQKNETGGEKDAKN